MWCLANYNNIVPLFVVKMQKAFLLEMLKYSYLFWSHMPLAIDFSSPEGSMFFVFVILFMEPMWGNHHF